MKYGMVTALWGLVFTLVLVNAISIDLEITKEMEQAIHKDNFVISVKDIKPKKQTKYTVETLFAVNFPGAGHKLALKLDRGTKKVIVETLEDGWKRTQHIIVDTLHDENIIRSLILAVNQTKPAAHVSLYIDCIYYGIVATPKPMRDMLSSMKNPMIEVFNDREYQMEVDDDINLKTVLSRNGCPATVDTKVFNNDDFLNNHLNDDPNVPVSLIVEKYDRADIPINTIEDGAILKSLNALIKIVNVEIRKCKENTRAIEDIRRLLENCDPCRNRRTCATHPPKCFHGVKCQDTEYGPRCGSCPPRYTGNGEQCTRISCSENNPCFHGVTCRDGYYGPECDSCPSGYEGDGITCTPTTPRPVLTCAQRNPCFHDVICRDSYYGPKCDPCPSGYYGDGMTCTPTTPPPVLRCSQRNPCFNGVICRDSYYGPKCDPCPSGYYGDGMTCTPTTAPPVLTCSQRNPCFNAVICRDSYYGPKCDPCPSGYDGDGITCTPTTARPVLTCAQRNPCFHDVICRDSYYGPKCDPCPSGYHGDGITCTPTTARPVLTCAQRNPCFHDVICRDSYYGPKCDPCPSGYDGDGITCTPTTAPPVLTCAQRNPCFHDVICRDSYYGPKCDPCPSGYEGDGITCTPTTHPCAVRNPCFSGVVCKDGPYGPECGSCPSGYEGNGVNCTYITPPPIKCSQRNPCFHGVICRDGDYGPECESCPTGYEGNGINCIPSQSLVNCSICFPGVSCSIGFHGAECGSCPSGYEGDGKTCTGVCDQFPNPCSSGNDCIPTDKHPYYICRCHEGSKWDGRKCIDIDECEVVKPCDPLVECTNLNPGYRCGPCPWGYTGSLGVHGVGIDFAINNKQRCVDIDECEDESTCGLRECINTEGSYTCGCKLVNQTCEWHPRDTCPSGIKCSKNAKCINLGFGQYACKCVTGWAGNGEICGKDTDLDGWPDDSLSCSDSHCVKDNCPRVPNSGQEDADGDLKGDVCDTDSDNDDVLTDDNCPFHYNPDQSDTDEDKIGDLCDNCPSKANPDQSDIDQDGKGDLCDEDIDEDGVFNEYDNCPNVANPDQKDSDNDGIGDACDNCVNEPNQDQRDLDQNFIGEVCDSLDDRDRDGIPDSLDNCVDDPNPNQLDTDNDGQGNECDDDDDNDGIIDMLDNCPMAYNPDQTYPIGNSSRGSKCIKDYDLDGIDDYKDNCPNNSLIHRTDFRRYQKVALDPQGDAQIDPNWEIYDHGSEIVETFNSDPGLAVGHDVLYGVDYEGTLFVDTDIDDDFIGIVFGYQSNKKFYTVMWKKNAQTYWRPEPFRAFAEPGIQIKVVDSVTGPSQLLRNSLWHNHNVTDQVSILWMDKKNVGWKSRTPYRWFLLHRPSIGLIRLKIFEGQNMITDSGNIFDSTFKGGRLGVLCFSQEMIVWSDVAYRCNENLNEEIWSELSPFLRDKIDIESTRR